MHAFPKNGKQPASSDSTDSFLNSKTWPGVEDPSKQIRLTTKESIVSESSQSVDVTGINMDDYETTIGSIASYG